MYRMNHPAIAGFKQPHNPKSVLLLRARLARRAARRVVQMARCRRLSLQGVPVLFANSFPKSGTHLLTQVLQGFTRIGPAVDSGLPAIVTFQGDTGQPHSPGRILSELKRLLPGDIAYGHIHAIPEAVAFLCQDGIAPYFILRDPRDVVISHVHYVTDMKGDHLHHQYYTQVLKDFDERLCASILGRPDLAVPFPDIHARFEPYVGWLEHAPVLALRYEDFIAGRDQAIRRVLDHAVQRGFPIALPRERALQVLTESINPQRSPTFRTGKIGGWRKQFNQQHRRLFKEVAGDLLVRLGYERDNDW